jgi:hypothetical protein
MFRLKLFSMVRLKLLSAAVMAVSALLVTGGAPVHAVGSGLYLTENDNWCVTPLNNNVGSELVLGSCSNGIAPSQTFYVDAVNSNSFMILNNQSGLCITYAYPNGHADGGYMTQGYCVGAQNQTFQATESTGGGEVYFLPDRRDNNGYYIALDDAGNNLVVDNHIDGSYACQQCASESWGQIYIP